MPNPNKFGRSALALLAVANWHTAAAFEDAKVMPKGIRRLQLRVLSTNISEKTDSEGTPQELEKPLTKPLRFKDILKGEKDTLKRNLTAGYISSEGFAESESVGSFASDLQGRVTVFAPIATYGLTENLTVAAALPVYNMAMSVKMGFKANRTGERFLASLTNEYNNQTASAQEAGNKINHAVARLNSKLTDNGYRPLENWNTTALGDAQLLAKLRVLDRSLVKVAVTGGVVAPTGRTDNPDILIDKGFGDGQWDLFAATSADQPLGNSGFTVSEFARYTNQLPDTKTVRMQTEEETIQVPKQDVAFNLGDKIETGAAVQYESPIGLQGGAGYSYYHKNADIYDAGNSAATLEKNTEEQAHVAEFELGYSGVPAFRRKEIPVPFDVKMSYKYQIASRNMARTNFVQLDAGVFF